jgi:choline dehydrogenase-like flavoprotein
MDIKDKYDAIIIGSGASGGVMAYELTRRGLDVLVLEKGRREDPQSFQHNELEMIPRLYKKGGLQTTVDNDLIIIQGKTVGGTTVINNAIWLRPDLDKVLGRWKEAGATVPKDELIKSYEELEYALKISTITEKQSNMGHKAFQKGCKALGIEADYLQNNRNKCIACGWCNFGCRYNRKTSMLVTYLPWAEQRGAVILDRCLDAEIVTKDKRAVGVKFNRDRKEEFIKADRVVVCCGGVGSSEMLLSSGIDLDGRVGKGFHVLGGIFAMAENEDKVDGFDGIGLTSFAHASEDYVIEDFFAPPATFSLSLSGFFLTHFNRMMRYPYYSEAGVMVGTDPHGVITIDKKKQAKINLKFNDKELAGLKKGLKRLVEIFFAGGAVKVMPASYKAIEFTSEADLKNIDSMIKRPEDLLLGSAHPQGGNRISDDPGQGVVSNQFNVHGYENLFVTDASVFPTNLWANCQATVMAISHYAANFVAK